MKLQLAGGRGESGVGKDHTYPQEERDSTPLVIRVAEGWAKVTSRRRFLRSVLEGTLLVGASGALVGGLFEQQAAAARHGPDCGPSPYCYCCGDNSNPCGSCKNRKYATSSCGSPICWISGNTLC